jgi:hypothetical protein
MEILSKLEEKIIKTTLLTIRINPKEKERLVKVLSSLLKKSKPDRFDEYVVNSLIEAIENPEVEVIKSKQESTSLVEKENSIIIEEKIEDTKIDKAAIINQIKSKTDPQNKDSLANWVKGSIEFAQKQMGIKTLPKSDRLEDFYDFLVESKIIDAEGNPLAKR